MRNPYGGRGSFPLDSFHDCNYVHYSLQLNIYKKILESNYGIQIRDMYLVCMHPTYDRYMKYEVMDTRHARPRLRFSVTQAMSMCSQHPRPCS